MGNLCSSETKPAAKEKKELYTGYIVSTSSMVNEFWVPQRETERIKLVEAWLDLIEPGSASIKTDYNIEYFPGMRGTLISGKYQMHIVSKDPPPCPVGDSHIVRSKQVIDVLAKTCDCYNALSF